MLRTFGAVFLMLIISSSSGRFTTRVEAASAWWNPNITAQQAADLYCAIPGHSGSGESAVIPTGGITLTNTQWTPVILRGVGCATPGSRSIGFSGIDYSTGNAPIDYSQSGIENVTGQTVTDASNVQLPGDEVWMNDNGTVPASGSLGKDITLRINRNLYPSSGAYDITLHGVTWYIDSTCPNPLHFSDIGGTGCTTPPNKTNSATIHYNVNIDALAPNGSVDSGPANQVTATASNIGKSCTLVTGWALDQDKPSSKLTINVYVNTAENESPEQLSKIYTTTADATRSDQYTGYGFSIPQDVLDQQVSLSHPSNTLIIKAVGVVQDGSAVGEGEDTTLGSVQISACLPQAPQTGKTKGYMAAFIGLLAAGGIVASLFALKLKYRS